MNLAHNILTLRTRKGITQKDLAEAMEVSRQAVSNWELGTARPSSEKLIKLAALFGVPVETLAEGNLGREEPAALPLPEQAEKTGAVPAEEKPFRSKKGGRPLTAGLAAACVVLAVLLVSNLAEGQAADTSPVKKYDPNFRDIALITEENEDSIGEISRGKDPDDPMPRNRIITDWDREAMVAPFSIVEARVEDGVTPALIGGNGSMCIFTLDDGAGWMLEEGDVLSWSFDRWTTGKYGPGQTVGIGYIKDGTLYPPEIYPGRSSCTFQLSAEESGEYYIYYECMSSDTVAIREGEIRLN